MIQAHSHAPLPAMAPLIFREKLVQVNRATSVRTPDLVGPQRRHAAQQVEVDLVCQVGQACLLARRQARQTHQAHDPLRNHQRGRSTLPALRLTQRRD